MSLKTRFLLLALLLVVLASIPTWFVFQRIAENIIEQWGQRVAEVQVRYDSARLQQPLEREIALARQLADSNVLKRWAIELDNPDLGTEAIKEMESFRRNFRDNNYFVALLEDGAYYHNNADDEFADRQLRYHLNPDNPDDAWFYRLIEQGRKFHLNVNPDIELGITQLWIDVIMESDGKVLGIVGTGLELEAFLRDIVDINQPGITTVFVDLNGAIQLYRDPQYIDYASIVKSEGQKNTLDLLLDTPGDRLRLQEMKDELRANPEPHGVVLSDFVSVDGKRHLAGIALLPEIGWYEITLMDLDELMPVSRFASVAVVFALILLATLILFYLVLKNRILNPLAALEAAMVQLRDGDLRVTELPRGSGEIGRLIRHFGAMAESIRSHTEELESKVFERTQALEQQARTDALTGLLNRHGMQQALDTEAQRALRQASHFGLIWLDIDNFKELNDNLGHGAGDQALLRVAQLLESSIRPYDMAARWGGDEFLVLLSPCDEQALRGTGERIRLAIEQEPTLNISGLTVSVGGSLAGPGEEIDAVLQRADDALYKAKAAGRNLFKMAG